MKLIISLLVYNQLEVTKKCIQSILDNSTSDYQLIISDNASRKDTQEYLSSLKDKRIKYIRNETNLGFIKAHNNVFESTQSKYFCVLNNDLIIKTKGWDSLLIKHLDDTQGLAQIGNKQVLGCIGDDGRGQARRGRQIDYIEGSCFIVNRLFVHTVGGLFEDKYMQFAFCEDADLSLRLRSHGYKIAECHDIDVFHFHHQSFKHEKVDIDFKKHEQENNVFLRTRWKKYIKTRGFEPMKILVDRQGALGDCLCVEPIIRGLAEKFPNSEIYVNTVCTEAFINNPYIAECGKSIKHKHSYDLMIDLNMVYEKNPEKHIVEAYMEKAEVKLYLYDKIPRYYGLSKSGISPIDDVFIVCSDNTWKNRMIPLDTWKKFIQYVGKNHKIVEVGIHPENYLGVGINLVGKLPFYDVVKLISTADLFMSWDSGLMHFSQAVGTPIFCFFGCINPKYRIHDWDTATVVWLNEDQLECAGCHHKLPAPRTFTQCNKDKIYCCENITVEMLIETFENRRK